MKFTPLTCLALATFAGAALTDLDDAGFMGLSAIEAGALVARDVGPAIPCKTVADCKPKDGHKCPYEYPPNTPKYAYVHSIIKHGLPSCELDKGAKLKTQKYCNCHLPRDEKTLTQVCREVEDALGHKDTLVIKGCYFKHSVNCDVACKIGKPCSHNHGSKVPPKHPGKINCPHAVLPPGYYGECLPDCDSFATSRCLFGTCDDLSELQLTFRLATAPPDQNTSTSAAEDSVMAMPLLV
ncbi:unnamed protein product [Zymoseptoria tritici ST99CH_1E4]|uniref:Uncharacterized protein n=1 Tax=Zymoseptoria tritici ST99CH_1E4 TaxID=1276532 RepID=A0A2H1H7Y8_ZYMTR|nr:unnamed protein product [Zymoseptoria tritici ST99CH_1E4]